MIKKLLTAASLLLTPLAATAGTATYDEDRSVLVMKGATDRVLRYQAINLMHRHQRDIEFIEMYGPGGNMTDMVAIMSAVKMSGLPVVIPQGEYCASACALAAIASDSVIVEGFLMFHNGYIPYYPKDISLHQILIHGEGMGLDIIKEIAKIDFKAAFLTQLVKWTGPDQWYFVTKASQINDCRMEGDTTDEFFRGCYISAPRMSTNEAWYMISASRSKSKVDTFETDRIDLVEDAHTGTVQ